MSETAVAFIPPPDSTIRCEIRWPWLDTNHWWVSQKRTFAVASGTPAATMVAVTPMTRSAGSDTDSAKGSSTTGVSQWSWATGTSASCSREVPGTRPEARAVAMARCPVLVTAASTRSLVAANPHDEPTSARMPMPRLSWSSSDSSWPLRAVNAR